MPIPCATERASRTASAEQQDAAGVVLRVAPQLQRHRDRRPRADEQRGDGGVHAAAHRDQRAAGSAATRRRPRPPRPARGAARPRPGRPRAACPARARRARRRSPRTPTRAASSSGSPSTSVTAAEPAAVSAPQPVGVEPGLDHAIAVDAHGDADQVTAERAAGVRRHARRNADAAPVGRGEMLFEALAVHERLSLGPAVDRAVGEAGLVEAAVELAPAFAASTSRSRRRGAAIVAPCSASTSASWRSRQRHDLQPLRLQAAPLGRARRSRAIARRYGADDARAGARGGLGGLLAADRRQRPARRSAARGARRARWPRAGRRR